MQSCALEPLGIRTDGPFGHTLFFRHKHLQIDSRPPIPSQKASFASPEVHEEGRSSRSRTIEILSFGSRQAHHRQTLSPATWRTQINDHNETQRKDDDLRRGGFDERPSTKRRVEQPETSSSFVGPRAPGGGEYLQRPHSQQGISGEERDAGLIAIMVVTGSRRAKDFELDVPIAGEKGSYALQGPELQQWISNEPE